MKTGVMVGDMTNKNTKKVTNYLLAITLTINIACLCAIGILSYKVYKNNERDKACWLYQLQLNEILLTPVNKDKLSI